MATKTNPKKISNIIQKYINKYSGKKHYKHETIYTMEPDDLAQICDFADYKKSKIFLCFYNFSEEKFDNMTDDEINAYAEGSTMFPRNKIHITQNGLEFGINVCVPARNGIVNKALINEILSHELMHAYRTYNECIDGHISHSKPSKRRKIDNKAKQELNVKYTYTDKMDRYSDILYGIKNDKSFRDKFHWIGYSLVTDEINATLAGVDAFLFENNGDYKKLQECRSISMMEIMKEYLDEIKINASDKDWEYCRENVLYINERKDESLERFKKRYVTYYTKQLEYFDTKVQKLVDKYKMISARQKILAKRIKNNVIIQHFTKSSYDI